MQETFRLCQKHLDGVVLVDNASISAAIKDMFTETRTIVEPAGALAIAGAKAYLSWNNMKVHLFHFPWGKLPRDTIKQCAQRVTLSIGQCCRPRRKDQASLIYTCMCVGNPEHALRTSTAKDEHKHERCV